MSEDAATQMKSRLRSDLLAAMRSGRKREVALLRELLAAIDNAEAPPLPAARPTAPVNHEFLSGSAEVQGLILGAIEVRALLWNEVQKREQAAAEFERLGEMERAATLRAEALLAKRYI